ncbi:MAG: hypothetical protein JNL83_13255 [Myxococcales bacterium]|nr:hypothetical protein [Myxococcales bacterium]
MRLAAVVLAAVVGACGDDGYDPNGCLPEGDADVEGMVRNQPIGPFASAQIRPTGIATGPQYAIVLDENATACGEVSTTGKRLVLLFCEMPINVPYTVASQLTFVCPTNDVLAIVETAAGEDFAVATSGTIDLFHLGSCMNGGYEIDFGIDRLTGAFDAVVCE